MTHWKQQKNQQESVCHFVFSGLSIW